MDIGQLVARSDCYQISEDFLAVGLFLLSFHLLDSLPLVYEVCALVMFGRSFAASVVIALFSYGKQEATVNSFFLISSLYQNF